MNAVSGSPDDGIKVVGANSNCIFKNTPVTNNGFTDLGVPILGSGGAEVSTSNNNRIDCNEIRFNGDMLTDLIRLLSGTGNFGSNVPPGSVCPASPAACPALSCAASPSP